MFVNAYLTDNEIIACVFWLTRSFIVDTVDFRELR